MMKEEDKETPKDPLTGETFTKKRSNQVFANRENQIKYNNIKAAKERQAKARTRKILDTNRTVLQKVLGSNNEIVKSLDYLLGAGLHFGFSTHTMKIEGLNWICVDDYAYTAINTNTFKIIKLNF